VNLPQITLIAFFPHVRAQAPFYADSLTPPLSPPSPPCTVTHPAAHTGDSLPGSQPHARSMRKPRSQRPLSPSPLQEISAASRPDIARGPGLVPLGRVRFRALWERLTALLIDIIADAERDNVPRSDAGGGAGGGSVSWEGTEDSWAEDTNAAQEGAAAVAVHRNASGWGNGSDTDTGTPCSTHSSNSDSCFSDNGSAEATSDPTDGGERRRSRGGAEDSGGLFTPCEGDGTPDDAVRGALPMRGLKRDGVGATFGCWMTAHPQPTLALERPSGLACLLSPRSAVVARHPCVQARSPPSSPPTIARRTASGTKLSHSPAPFGSPASASTARAVAQALYRCDVPPYTAFSVPREADPQALVRRAGGMARAHNSRQQRYGITLESCSTARKTVASS